MAGFWSHRVLPRRLGGGGAGVSRCAWATETGRDLTLDPELDPGSCGSDAAVGLWDSYCYSGA